MTSGIDSPQDLGPFCTSVGHERLPAAAVGAFDDGDEAYPDVPYCASCAHALIECGEFTVTRVLNASAFGLVACPECGGTGRLSRASGAKIPSAHAPAARDADEITGLIRALDGTPPDEMTGVFYAHAYWQLRAAVDALLGLPALAASGAVPSPQTARWLPDKL